MTEESNDLVDKAVAAYCETRKMLIEQAIAEWNFDSSKLWGKNGLLGEKDDN